jgi:exopolyphosphatase / guanosine-5'-triphosphate,3'-diphosphate pyrophosphatase
MALAVLDLGSNSFHLAIFEPRGEARGEARGETRGEARGEAREGRGPEKVYRKKRMVRLAAGTLAQGFIDDETCHRALDAIGELLGHACARRAGSVVAVATSAIREARNGVAFTERVRARFGLDVEILSGRDEARLTYRGARASLDRPTGRIAVADLGGGSLELAGGLAARDWPDVVHSLPLGVLRLRDRYVRDGGRLGGKNVETIAAAVRAVAGRATQELRARGVGGCLFTAGTARAVARLIGGETPTVARDDLADLVTTLARLPPAEIVALGVDERRADTVAIGAVVMLTTLELLGFGSLTVVDSGLREGVALRELSRGRTAQGGAGAAPRRVASRRV